jgi:hypothetical protein
MPIKKLLDESGLYVAEFGTLCGVSRQTVHNWMTGFEIAPLRKPKVDKLVAAIARAVEHGDLPAGELSSRKRTTKAVRAELIKNIVIKHLRAIAAST